MDIITRFGKKYINDTNSMKYGFIEGITEMIGPEDNEGFCHFAFINGNYVHTVPHIDVFKIEGDNRTIFNKNMFPAYNASDAAYFNERGKDNILLSGETLDITAKYYGNDIVSLSQYFLDNPTRENKIQYLIEWNEEGEPFVAFIPGLLTSESGTVIGFIHSYVVNSQNEAVLEIPYADGKTYSLLGSGFTCDMEDNKFRIRLSNNIKTELTLSNGSDSISFCLYPKNYNTTEKSYRVKVANEYGDYTIAAQITEHNKIKEVLDVLSSITQTYFNPEKGYAPLPAIYKSLALIKFAESVKNITLDMYKVPVAFVPKDTGFVFMTDITGISTNEII